MCCVLTLSSAGYYKWKSRIESLSKKDREDAVLKNEIKRIHKESRATYCRPRLLLALAQQGYQCGRHRAIRLMKEEDIQGIVKKRFRAVTTNSDQPYPIAKNLLLNREFAKRP